MAATTFNTEAPLRIVCTRCPAVATLHYQYFDMSTKAFTVWAECHGEHKFAEVDAETLRRSRNAFGEDVAFLFEGLRVVGDDATVETMRNETEQQMLELARRLELFDQFLARRKGPAIK
jgi:hypothetical protein